MSSFTVATCNLVLPILSLTPPLNLEQVKFLIGE